MDEFMEPGKAVVSKESNGDLEVNGEPEQTLYDRYGFQLPKDRESYRACRNGAINEKATRPYMRKLNERLIKWQFMLQDWDHFYTKQPAKVISRVRKGVPDPVRGLVWQQLLGSQDLPMQHPDVYMDLLDAGPQSFDDQIKRDITRTFPTNEFFRERGQMGERSLYNVVRAYAVYDSGLAYCQGMNVVTGVLLFYMTDEEAFWALVQMMRNKRCPLAEVFRIGFPELEKQLWVFSRLIQKFFPKLHARFQAYNITTHFFATQWFMTIYAYNFPFETVLRIWDGYLLEGELVLYQIGLGLLKLALRKMLNMDEDDLMQYLHAFPAEYLNPDTLLKSALSLKLKDSVVNKLEAEYWKTHDAPEDLPPLGHVEGGDEAACSAPAPGRQSNTSISNRPRTSSDRDRTRQNRLSTASTPGSFVERTNHTTVSTNGTALSDIASNESVELDVGLYQDGT